MTPHLFAAQQLLTTLAATPFRHPHGPALPSGMIPPHSPWGYARPSDTADVSPAKAREILRDGSVHGHPLTGAQRGMFGAIAGKTDNDARNRYAADPRNRPPAVYAPRPDGDSRYRGPHYGG